MEILSNDESVQLIFTKIEYFAWVLPRVSGDRHLREIRNRRDKIAHFRRKLLVGLEQARALPLSAVAMKIAIASTEGKFVLHPYTILEYCNPADPERYELRGILLAMLRSYIKILKVRKGGADGLP